MQSPGRRPLLAAQEIDVQPGQARSISYGRLRIDLDAASFAQPVRLSLRELSAPTVTGAAAQPPGPTDAPPVPEHLKLPFVFRIEARTAAGQLVRQHARPVRELVPRWHKEVVDPNNPPLPAQVLGLRKLTLASITEKDAAGAALPATGFTHYTGLISGTSEYYKLQLKDATNGYGGKTTYTYEGHTPDLATNFRRRYRIKQTQTESGVGRAGGVSSTITRTYAYGPSYQVNDSYDYRGHGEVTVTDGAGHFEKHFFYTRDAVNGKSVDDVTVLQSRRYKHERWKSGAGTATVVAETDWSYVTTQATAKFARVDEAREYRGSRSRKTRSEYDGYGNVVKTKEYDSAGAPVGSWVRHRVAEFYPSVGTNRYIVGKPARTVLYKPGGGPDGDWVRDARYYYDGSTTYTNPIGTGDDGSLRGRLTAVRSVLDATNSVDATYGHDGYGNLTTVTAYGEYGPTGGGLASGDPRTATTTYDTFPATVTNALGHVVSGTFDPKWGRPLTATDPNGGATNYTYDTYGRLTKVEGPSTAGPSGTYRPTTEHTYSPPAVSGGRTTTQRKTRVRTDLGTTILAWRSSWKLFDGLGRVVQEYAQTQGGVNVANHYHDARGLKWRESVSHFVGDNGGAFLSSDWGNYSGPSTRPTYDELHRVRVVTLPSGNTTERTYDGWDSESIDQKRHKNKYEHDALGRLVTVREYTGTDASWAQYAATTYSYDAADLLRGVTDAAGNQTTIDFDTLGRKTRLVDPDAGTWTYEYDPIGTLKAQTDAKGQRIDSFYDALGRLVRKWHPAAWTQETITGGTSRPTVHDLMELRCAVDVDRAAAGLSTGGWTDPEIVAGARGAGAGGALHRAQDEDPRAAGPGGSLPAGVHRGRDRGRHAGAQGRGPRGPAHVAGGVRGQRLRAHPPGAGVPPVRRLRGGEPVRQGPAHGGVGRRRQADLHVRPPRAADAGRADAGRAALRHAVELRRPRPGVPADVPRQRGRHVPVRGQRARLADHLLAGGDAGAERGVQRPQPP
jgi:YD repeat-containing protein